MHCAPLHLDIYRYIKDIVFHNAYTVITDLLSVHEHLLKKVMFLCCFVVVTTETCMELFSREGEFCLFFFLYLFCM